MKATFQEGKEIHKKLEEHLKKKPAELTLDNILEIHLKGLDQLENERAELIDKIHALQRKRGEPEYP